MTASSSLCRPTGAFRAIGFDVDDFAAMRALTFDEYWHLRTLWQCRNSQCFTIYYKHHLSSASRNKASINLSAGQTQTRRRLRLPPDWRLIEMTAICAISYSYWHIRDDNSLEAQLINTAIHWLSYLSAARYETADEILYAEKTRGAQSESSRMATFRW